MCLYFNFPAVLCHVVFDIYPYLAIKAGQFLLGLWPHKQQNNGSKQGKKGRRKSEKQAEKPKEIG